MTESIELVAGQSPRMRAAVRVIKGPFDEAAAVCRSRLHAGDIDVHLMNAPSEVIPEWGLGGYTYGPHSIVLAVDPDHRLEPVNVFSTLVHEFHHAIRWRGPGPGTSLGERLVEEGLAQVFEAEVTGQPPLYARGEIDQQHRVIAMQHLDENPVDEGRWFFGSKDLPRWFGYRLGYDLARTALKSLDSDAAAAVREPATTFSPWLR